MRTENDSWDITTSVGSTALFVAASRALEAQKSDPLATDQFAEVFCRAAGGVWPQVLDGAAPDFPLATEFGHHFIDYQGARTKFFDTYFDDAAADGVRQIVLLASGLDSRAYRLAWPAGTVVYELDQPQVLEFKREVLAKRGDAPTAERREIAVDLRHDWPQALRDNGFDPAEPSAWIAEGLLMYLPAEAERQLFAGIDALAAPGSHVAIEETVPLDAAAFEAKLEEERAAPNENFRYFHLVYNEQHEPSAQWFGNRGWRMKATPLADYLQQVGRPLPATDSAAGPMVANARLVKGVKEV